MKPIIERDGAALAGGTLLLGLFLFIPPGEVQAHVEMCPNGLGGSAPCINTHNGNVSHLADTAFSACVGIFGREACSAARAVPEAVSQGVQGVVDTAVECTTSLDAAGNCIAAGQDALVGIVGQVTGGAGLAPELLDVAVLQGTVTMEIILNGATPIDQRIILRVEPEPVEPPPSLVCSAAISAMLKLYPVQQGTPFNIPVSACTEVTYVLTPAHPLYTWNPPNRRVTVGAAGGENNSGEQEGVTAESTGRTGSRGRGNIVSESPTNPWTEVERLQLAPALPGTGRARGNIISAPPTAPSDTRTQTVVPLSPSTVNKK